MTDNTTYTFGLDTFGDRNGDADGVPVSHAQTIRNVVEEGVFAATDEQAKDEFWPRYREIITLMAPERGFALPTASRFDWETGPDVALFVGSPETVARKIAANLRALGATRFDLKYGMPNMTHDQHMTSIDLYGRKVIPLVHDLLATDTPASRAHQAS